MGIKERMLKKMDGESMVALKGLSKEFNNLENQILTCQENQVEFEKYLKDILKKQNEILNILKDIQESKEEEK